MRQGVHPQSKKNCVQKQSVEDEDKNVQRQTLIIIWFLDKPDFVFIDLITMKT